MKTAEKQAVFNAFVQQESLTDEMAEKFMLYLKEIQAWNKHINLTTITDEKRIILYHFQDSLILRKYVDLSQISGLVDIGSGAGFPGIPLAICNPAMHIILIEVKRKKIEFLQYIIDLLHLTHVEVCDMDWRTFLRKTEIEAQLFCTRASLSMSELFRMFKPSSPYKGAQLVYWASGTWQPTDLEKKYIVSEKPYVIGNRSRKLVFLKNITKDIRE